jgi:hypothetical protein
MKRIIPRWLLASSMLVGCWAEPEDVDLRDPWVVDLTIAYSSTSSCTLSGAALQLTGHEPYEAYGTLDGGDVTCTGGATWSPSYRAGGRIWGRTVSVQLSEPHSLRYSLLLRGDARPELMGGEIRSYSGDLLGTWSAHQ